MAIVLMWLCAICFIITMTFRLPTDHIVFTSIPILLLMALIVAPLELAFWKWKGKL